jgi:triacylglycerol lipase
MFKHWIKDYLHLVQGHWRMFKYKEPPKHYLGHVVKGKAPLILIPGVTSTWPFLKPIADKLSHSGHPVYILPRLGNNTFQISVSAKIVRDLIDKKDLKNAVIIAHSKGGLIGKKTLISYNKDNRIKKLIAIATPFGGSGIVKYLPVKFLKELHPKNKTLLNLQKNTKVNAKIVSIYGLWDNHVWPTESCYLKGAKNIKINILGHHKILSSGKVLSVIKKELSEK